MYSTINDNMAGRGMYRPYMVTWQEVVMEYCVEAHNWREGCSESYDYDSNHTPSDNKYYSFLLVIHF